MRATTKEIKAAVVKTLNCKKSEVLCSQDYSSAVITVNCMGQKAHSLEKADKAARQFEQVSRCEYTGDILSGGNFYIRTNYGKKVNADLQTLFFFLCDRIVEDMPFCDFRSSRHFFGQSAKRIVDADKESFEAFSELTERDFVSMCHAFGTDKAETVMANGKINLGAY
jgi:hypothetical protein